MAVATTIFLCLVARLRAERTFSIFSPSRFSREPEWPAPLPVRPNRPGSWKQSGCVFLFCCGGQRKPAYWQNGTEPLLCRSRCVPRQALYFLHGKLDAHLSVGLFSLGSPAGAEFSQLNVGLNEPLRIKSMLKLFEWQDKFFQRIILLFTNCGVNRGGVGCRTEPPQ